MKMGRLLACHRFFMICKSYSSTQISIHDKKLLVGQTELHKKLLKITKKIKYFSLFSQKVKVIAFKNVSDKNI